MQDFQNQQPIKDESKRVGKFSLVGLFNLLVDFGVYNLVILIMGFGAVPSNIISTTVAMVLSFVANKKYVFGDDQSKRLLVQASLFLMVTAFGLYIIQTGVIYLLMNVWSAPLEWIYGVLSTLGQGETFSPAVVFANSAKIIGVLFSACWNYVLYRGVVFNDQRGRVFDKIGDWGAEHRHVLVVFLIIIAAAVFRFWKLQWLPPGLSPQEAAGGLNAISLTEGNLEAVLNDTKGKGGLFHSLQALAISLLDNSMLALRLVAAALGVTSVIFIYMGVKEWFSQRAAILSGFFMASAVWAVQISRVNEPINMAIALIPLLLWFLSRAIKTNKAVWYVLSGVTIGGLFYTVMPLYVWVVFAILLLYFTRRYYSDYLKDMTQPILIIALSAFLVVLPMIGFDAINNGTETYVNIWEEFQITMEDPVLAADTLAINTIGTAGMFHFTGVENQLYNLGDEAHLNAMMGVLFVLGLLLAFRRYRDIRYFALLSLLLATLLPGIFLAEDTSRASAVAGALPMISILSAIGLVELFARWRGVFPRNLLAFQFSIVVILVIMGSSALYDWHRYFQAWANAPETFEAHHEASYQTAQYLLLQGGSSELYVVADEEKNLPVKYLTHGKRDYTHVTPEEADKIRPQAKDKIIVLKGEETKKVNFPKLEAENIHSDYRPKTVLYTVYTK